MTSRLMGSHRMRSLMLALVVLKRASYLVDLKKAQIRWISQVTDLVLVRNRCSTQLGISLLPTIKVRLANLRSITWRRIRSFLTLLKIRIKQLPTSRVHKIKLQLSITRNSGIRISEGLLITQLFLIPLLKHVNLLA